jgi:hypothetical protein
LIFNNHYSDDDLSGFLQKLGAAGTVPSVRLNQIIGADKMAWTGDCNSGVRDNCLRIRGLIRGLGDLDQSSGHGGLPSDSSPFKPFTFAAFGKRIA